MRIATKCLQLAAAATLLGASLAASAATQNFSFTGNFTRDDDIQLFNFSVGAASPLVTLRTWSYAGGVNAAGQVIARGGFDPILAVFDSTGARIGQNDDGAGVPVDLSGSAFDTLFQLSNLAAGQYTVAVMQYDNFSIGPNLSDGFTRTGQGNFTNGLRNTCANVPSFCDVSGNLQFNARTSAWAFDILDVESASTTVIPVPAALPLFAAGLALFGFAARRRAA